MFCIKIIYHVRKINSCTNTLVTLIIRKAPLVTNKTFRTTLHFHEIHLDCIAGSSFGSVCVGESHFLSTFGSARVLIILFSKGYTLNNETSVSFDSSLSRFEMYQIPLLRTDCLVFPLT